MQGPRRDVQPRVFGLMLWALVMAAGILALLEVSWRRDHAPAHPDAWSAGGGHAAEIRFLPEGTPAPHGVGVFIRPTWSPLHFAQAGLVFAGYCSAMSTRWTADDQVQVNCELSPGGKEPWLAPSPVGGVTVKLRVIRPRAVA